MNFSASMLRRCALNPKNSALSASAKVLRCDAAEQHL
jgi:hypothetical protein